MTTNQTIDGVPRKICHACVTLARNAYCPVCDDAPAAQIRGEPVACAHDWLDDGEYLIVCTKCGAQENHDPCWRDMASAPTDGTMVRLLVEFEEHSTEDADQAPTIGANNLDNDEEDAWRFAGWCWTHDHFTEGKGTPVGWLPMLDDPVSTPAAQPHGEPVLYVAQDSIDDPECDGMHATRYPNELQCVPLYAYQPAPVAVVLPERLPGDDGVCTESHYASGWNACLDEVTRLNPSL